MQNLFGQRHGKGGAKQKQLKKKKSTLDTVPKEKIKQLRMAADAP